MPLHDIDSLVTEAHDCWELGDHAQAAALFFEAARLESEAAAKRGAFAKADQSFLYRARAAYCLWDAGQFDKARPILTEVTSFDWKRAGLWADRHDTEKAFSRLILEAAAAADLRGFSELWHTATARCGEINWLFPKIVPNQKKLLQAAMALGQTDACRQILERIDAKFLSKDHELQVLRMQAKRICGEA